MSAQSFADKLVRDEKDYNKEHFHLFKDASDKKLAVCGYRADLDPRTSRDPYPKCAQCLEWFKALQWKKGELIR